jgi:hypothetical protein
VTDASPHYFTPGTMRFFGDTMSNYRVGKPVTFVSNMDETVTCWPLIRKRPVKNGMIGTTYFDTTTFQKRFRKDEP